jgi:hypothetical protein
MLVGCVKNLPSGQEKLPPARYVCPMLSDTLRCAALVLIITNVLRDHSSLFRKTKERGSSVSVFRI